MRGFIFLSLCCLCVLSCTSGKREGNIHLPVKTIRDDLGRVVQVPDSATRVLAMSSSLTEMLYLLIEEDRIVARTQNDSFPQKVLTKPVINNYPIDFEKLIVLKPDLVLAKEGIVSADDAAKIESLGVPVYFQKYDSLPDILSGIEDLGELLKVEKRGRFVADSLRSIIDSLNSRVKYRTSPSVLVVISDEPIYVYGMDSYISSILSAAGATNAVDQVFDNPFPSLRREYILKIDPEVILGVDSIKFFNKYPELKNTRAFKNNRFYRFDGELISRPGPRIGEGISEIQRIVHGEK